MRRTIARKELTSVGGCVRVIGLPRWECGNQTNLTASLTDRCEEERLSESDILSKKVPKLLLGCVTGQNASLENLTTKPGGKRPRE